MSIKNITKRGIWCFCFAVSVIIVVVMYTCSREVSQSSENNRAVLPPYAHFFKIPKQKNPRYPMIFESEGMIDYSSIIIFEADSEWIKKIVQCNGLSPDPSQVGISTIARNAKYLGLKQISDVIDSNTWNSFEIKSVQFFSNGETYKVYFELYTNTKQTIVVLHFHSVEIVNKKIRSCKRSGLSQWTVYNTGMKRTALNNIPTFAITAATVTVDKFVVSRKDNASITSAACSYLCNIRYDYHPHG